MAKKSKQPRTLIPIRNNAKGKNKRKPKEPIKGGFYMDGKSKFHD